MFVNIMCTYLPTPRVQKPGDNPKNFQTGTQFYLRTFFLFHFFQCNNSTLPTKLMNKKCNAPIDVKPLGGGRAWVGDSTVVIVLYWGLLTVLMAFLATFY